MLWLGIVCSFLLAGGGLLLVYEPHFVLADLRLGSFGRGERQKIRGATADFVSSVLPYFGPSFVRAYRTLDMTPKRLLIQALGGFAVVEVFAVMLGGTRFVAGGILGLAYPIFMLPMQAETKRKQMIAALPDFALYLNIFLGLGYSMHRAMAAATEYMGGPLREALDHALTRLVIETDPAPVIQDLSKQVNHTDVGLFFDAMLSGWNSDAPMDVMRGIADTMDRMRDGAIAAKTGQIPSTMQVLVMIALLDTMLLWAVPFVTSMMTHMSVFSGGL